MQRAERRKYHYIYKTTCSITSRFYIGMHSTDDLNDGYKGSGKRLWYSIRKHGRENHSTEILEFCPSRNDLKLREAKIVNEELLDNEQCMNLKLGGEGGWDHLEKDDKYYQVRRDNGSNSSGWKIFNDQMQSNPELRVKWKEKVSNAHKNGLVRYDTFAGKKHTEETKNKMRDKAKERIGEKNSQFGTCWVFNLEVEQSKKIKNDDLNSFLELGWIIGRKIFKTPAVCHIQTNPLTTH
jgi:hypothetical protein